MYTGMVFIGYIASICLGILGVSLFLLIVVLNKQGKTELFKSIRSFAVLILLNSLLYFYFFCNETIFHDYEVGVFFRVIDYVLNGLIFYHWFQVLYHLYRKTFIRYAGLIFSGCYTIIGSIIGGAFCNGYYEITNQAVRNFFRGFEIVIALVLIILLLKTLVEYLPNEVDFQRRAFVTVNSILIIIWNVNSTIIDIGLYQGRFGKSAWALNVFDPTSIIMLLIALITMIFVFREDFSPLYRMEEKQEEEIDIISVIADENQLSVRECDTLRLLHEGYSNLEIADELCISINTVKKHVKNIYAKMGVVSRVDLAHFISERKDRK